MNCLILNIRVSIHIDLTKLQSLFLNLREGSDNVIELSDLFYSSYVYGKNEFLNNQVLALEF